MFDRLFNAYRKIINIKNCDHWVHGKAKDFKHKGLKVPHKGHEGNE